MYMGNILLCEVSLSGFLSIDGLWGREKKSCTLVNVYAPCSRQGRAMSWNELIGKLRLRADLYIIAGDFKYSCETSREKR